MNKNRGVAIIAAVFMLTLIVWIATEVAFETSSEYAIHARSIHRLQAFHNARSGLEISRIRIFIYQTLKSKFPQAGPMLNVVWQMPFTWPLVVPNEISQVDKDEINEIVKSSTIQGGFTTLISDEGSKLDINDLASPALLMQQRARTQLLNLFQEESQQNRDFANVLEGKSPDQIINLIKDWIDNDQVDSGGGGEIPEAFNRWLKAPEEILLIKTVPFGVLEFLLPRITVFGQKAVNPNTADMKTLQILLPRATPEMLQEIINRRENPRLGGPYQNSDDFFNYARSRGVIIDPNYTQQLLLTFDSVESFRIKSIGEYKGVTHTIEAVVWNHQKVAQVIGENFAQQLINQGQGLPNAGFNNQTNVQGQQQNSSLGLFPIVYWMEP